MAIRALKGCLVLLGAVVFLGVPSAIYSCGPFFEPTIFAFDDQPEAPQEDFAAGTLGIVRPGFRLRYLVVAYRYLAGLKLTADEQKAVLQVWSGDAVPRHPAEDEALGAWSKAREKVANVPAAPPISTDAVVSPDQPYEKFLNCPGEAFVTAARTLEDRTAKYKSDAALREWVEAQDQVFGNCGGAAHLIPAALTSGEPLPRADRAYQVAAAQFYARSYDGAVAAFDTIAQDHGSPWAQISPYLAARALIRKGVLVHAQNEPFDRAALLAAAERLQKIVDDPHAGALRDSAVNLINLVRFRTEPEKRVAELDRVMLRPQPGANFKQALWDYLLLLSQGTKAEDPSDWATTFYAPESSLARGGTDPARAEHAVAKWKQEKSLPWLVAALSSATPKDAAVPELLAAAGKVPAASPGYLTVRYQALRLMIGSGQVEGARVELEALLKKPDISLGAHNLFNEERQRVATSLDDFLRHAWEQPVPAEMDADTMQEVPANAASANPSPNPDETEPSAAGTAGVAYFNSYPTQVMTRRLPLAALLEAAASPHVPKNLRREGARSTWTRAVLLADMETADRLQSVLQELDAPLWKSMAPFRDAKTADEKRFAAIFIILQNPGLKPSAREGAPRRATLGEIDNYRENWWCADMGIGGGDNWGQNYSVYNQDTNLKFVERDPQFPYSAWLTEKERAAAREELLKLIAIGTAPNYFASQVIEYARAHPEDARVPQALHLAVRSTRYGCTNIQTSPLSKAAFEYLHAHYPESEWAGKTKYYY